MQDKLFPDYVEEFIDHTKVFLEGIGTLSWTLDYESWEPQPARAYNLQIFDGGLQLDSVSLIIHRTQESLDK